MLAEYDILGVDKNATREEITAAYRRAAMRWHPDRNPDDPDATERFQEIERAYRLLLQITPRVRLASASAAPDGGAAFDPELARAAAEAERAARHARATARWRTARDWDNDVRRRHAEAREATERVREQAARAIVIKSPLFALIAVAAAAITALLFPPPLSFIAPSAALLLATLLQPRGGDSYTAVIVEFVISYGVKLYFIGLFLWLLWQAADRVIV